MFSKQIVPSLVMVNNPLSSRAEVSATKDGFPEPCLKTMRPLFVQDPTAVTVNGVAGDNNPNAEPKNISPLFSKAATEAKS